MYDLRVIVKMNNKTNNEKKEAAKIQARSNYKSPRSKSPVA